MLVTLKIDRTLLSYGLPEKLHGIAKNASVLGLAIFQIDLYLVQKNL